MPANSSNSCPTSGTSRSDGRIRRTEEDGDVSEARMAPARWLPRPEVPVPPGPGEFADGVHRCSWALPSPRRDMLGRPGPRARRGRVSARGHEIGGIMRLIQAVIFLAFLGAVGLFAVQNTEAITVDFWTWKVTGPVALLAIAAYLLGMVSGWTVVAFVRRSLRRVSEHPRD